jgi:hypothetical protein
MWKARELAMKSVNGRAFMLITTVMLVISAVSATASAAHPELVNKEGKELVKKSVTFTSGTGTFESVRGQRLTCSSDTGTGLVTGTSTATGTVKFKGCEAFGNACSSAGAGPGEIVSFTDLQLLLILNPSNMTFEPAWVIETGKVEINCGSLERVEVKGTAIATFTPVKKLVKSLSIKLLEKKGVEEYTEYINEKSEKIKANLETEGSGLVKFGPEEAGLENEETMTFEEEVEVR